MKYPDDLAVLLGALRTQCGMNNRPHTFATTAQMEKVEGSPRPGSRLEIIWANGDLVDHGYLFTLPGLEDDDVWMGGAVHVPQPDNPGGMDAAPPVWETLDSLLRNRRVKRIIVKERV